MSDTQGIKNVNLENSVFEETSTNKTVDNGEILQFRDVEAVKTVTTGHLIDETSRAIDYNRMALNDFFARPVRIHVETWSLNTTYFTVLNPWQLYFNNPAVVRKLSNFEYIQAKLNIRVVLNGTNFHYGFLMSSYLPLDRLNSTHDPSTVAYVGNNIDVKQSMLMNVEVDPVNNKVGEMELPFIYPYDAIDIASLIGPSASHDYLGSLVLNSFTPLGAASATPVANLTISVFAYASDVMLTGPTAQTYSGQSNESVFGATMPTPSVEQSKGVISEPMNLISRGTSVMKQVPIIGSTMGKISTVASTIASAVSQWGFSKPTQMEPACYVKRQPVSSVANTKGVETVQKLTFDPKQSVSVNPLVANVDAHDELALSRFYGKMCYITSVPWVPTDPVGNVLASGSNHPCDINATSITNGVSYLPTPLAATCIPFKYWSGTLCYRIKVIASNYHSGRLKLTYTPGTAVASAEFNTQFSVLIDLEQETDVVIRIPWMSNRPYLHTKLDNEFELSIGSTTRAFQDDTENGRWDLSVVNQLVSPYELAGVNILFFKWADEDFEVFDPIDTHQNTGITLSSLSPNAPIDLALAAKVEGEPPKTIEPVAVVASGTMANDGYLFGSTRDGESALQRKAIFHGDPVDTFRDLLKRYMFEHRYATHVDTSSETRFRSIIDLPRQPIYPGETPFGSDALNLTDALVGYNYGNLTLLSYLATMFVGHRGSFRSKFLITTRAIEVQTVTVARNSDSSFTFEQSMTEVSEASSSEAAAEYVHYPSGWSGSNLTDAKMQRVLETEFPYFSNQRFWLNGPTAWGCHDYFINTGIDDNYIDQLIADSTSLDNTTNDREFIADRWIAAGEDFNFLFFLGPSLLYTTTTLPTPRPDF